eukprot:3376670-Amphidinium_carterae.2
MNTKPGYKQGLQILTYNVTNLLCSSTSKQVRSRTPITKSPSVVCQSVPYDAGEESCHKQRPSGVTLTCTLYWTYCIIKRSI